MFLLYHTHGSMTKQLIYFSLYNPFIGYSFCLHICYSYPSSTLTHFAAFSVCLIFIMAGPTEENKENHGFHEEMVLPYD